MNRAGFIPLNQSAEAAIYAFVKRTRLQLLRDHRIRLRAERPGLFVAADLLRSFFDRLGLGLFVWLRFPRDFFGLRHSERRRPTGQQSV